MHDLVQRRYCDADPLNPSFKSFKSLGAIVPKLMRKAVVPSWSEIYGILWVCESRVGEPICHSENLSSKFQY